jgi:hypothetical protein
MRPLALAAAATLAAGCTVAPCDRSIVIDWSFTDLAGATNLRCADVGVAYVDVFVDGSPIVHTNTPNCTDYGATLLGLSAGPHAVVVEGYDQSGVIIDRDLFTAPADCSGNPIQAQPGEGALRLDYHFLPEDACGAPPTYLWYQVTDLTSGRVIASITSASTSPKAAPCLAGAGLTFAVPNGPYRLDWIGEVDLTTSTPLVLYQDCTAASATVAGPGTSSISATLTSAAGLSSTCVQ